MPHVGARDSYNLINAERPLAYFRGLHVIVEGAHHCHLLATLLRYVNIKCASGLILVVCRYLSRHEELKCRGEGSEPTTYENNNSLKPKTSPNSRKPHCFLCSGALLVPTHSSLSRTCLIRTCNVVFVPLVSPNQEPVQPAWCLRSTTYCGFP